MLVRVEVVEIKQMFVLETYEVLVTSCYRWVNGD
jgi:hypothetical protein